MVLKKRQDNGFNNFHVPFIPRAPRSARRRGLHKKKVEDDQICAFELLASLAGKLLQETESSSASSNASETNNQPGIGDDVFKHNQGEDKQLKTECIDQGSCEESVFIPEFTSASSDQKCLLKESLHTKSVLAVDHFKNSHFLDKASDDVKSVISKSKISCDNLPCKVEEGSLIHGTNGCIENGINGLQTILQQETEGLTVHKMPGLKDPMESCTKFPAFVNRVDNVRLPSCRDSVPNASILKLRNDLNIGTRDNDEKFSRFNKFGTKPRAYRHPSRIRDRRIRKLLTSKYWKVAPKWKDCDLSKVALLDGGMKPLFRKRKIYYNRERCQHDILNKRRKFSDHSSVVTSDGGFSSESVCNSPEKSMQVDKNSFATMFHGENGMFPATVSHQTSSNSKDSHVKLSIESLMVPELLIEVPETTTVGSLKRTVMETVQAMLGGGFCVGVVLQGKKVKGNDRTLLQTGITSKENLDSLGFTLEPHPGQSPPPLCTEDSPIPLSCDTAQLVPRSPVAPVLDSGSSNALPDPSVLTKSVDKIESSHQNADNLTDKTPSDSRALVIVPPVSVDAHAVVPVNQKTRRSELVQRRTRRPFSVSEVEALVKAVEELGTGRWRDVKLSSFEDADHRTYVDLKDKWKTLVHTAKIAPQQRRGEPVPQELLDRVLAAHAYWSQHQSNKQHNKNQAAVLKITEAPGGRNGIEGTVM